MDDKENNPAAQPGQSEFVITRMFDAPRDLVWQAHAEAGRLAQWWGPIGFSLHVATLDFKPGGVFHYAMRAATGFEMWGRFSYREIVAPERIVFVNSFADQQGNAVRAPFNPNWPLEVANMLTLTEQGGKTTLSLRGTPLNATDTERAVFEAGFESMRQGFGGTYDQLAAYLAKVQS